MKLIDFYEKYANTFRAMRMIKAFAEVQVERTPFTNKQRKHRKVRNIMARESRRRNRR